MYVDVFERVVLVEDALDISFILLVVHFGTFGRDVEGSVVGMWEKVTANSCFLVL